MLSNARLLTCGVFLAANGLLHHDLQAAAAPLRLVPAPAHLERRAGVARLAPFWTIRMASGSEDADAVRLLADESLQDLGSPWRVVRGGAGAHSIELRSAAAPPQGRELMAEQGYELIVKADRIVIAGASAEGRFLGVQTLRQLMRARSDGVIPCLRIVDYPALRWRGISDDISRGQISTLEDFKAIVRQLAYYKLNLYQLYIEDVYQFENARPDDRAEGMLSRTELEQIVAEGRRNHVVVTPIFETLTHQERLFASEDTRHAAAGVDLDSGRAPWAAGWAALVRRAHDVLDRLLRPDREAPASSASFSAGTLPFSARVQSLVHELAGVTRGPFFGLGGDEWQPPASVTAGGAAGAPVTAGSASATSSDADSLRSYGRCLGGLADQLRREYGCRAMVYGDVILAHPEAGRDLPRDVVIMDWQYEPADSYPSIGRLHAQGFKDVMVCPALWTWQAFYPNECRGFRNIASFAQAGKREGAFGCVTASWGDDGAENLRENNWAGYAYAAAASWEAGPPEPGEFLRRFVVSQYGADDARLARAEMLLGWQEFPGVGWNARLYHRPFPVRPRPVAVVARMDSLRSDMRAVLSDLDAAGPGVRFHRDHLAAARYCARRYEYLAERELLMDSLGRDLTFRTAASLPRAERERMAASIGRLEAQADSLEREFGPLWLKRNRPGGLAEVTTRLSKQGAMLRSLRTLAREGSLGLDSTFAGLQVLKVPSPR